MPEPFELSAVAAKEAMVAGALSPSELLESCLHRIDEADPVVNAMVTRADERARHQASAADGVLAGLDRTGRSQVFAERPLLGLPIGIKDLQATEGIRTTLGSTELADNVPSADAAIVAKVRAAGAIVVGKTNIPERSIGANTVNRLFGATGNPFDPQKTCGGSSGGSAVALSAGMVPLATGSDHGGSLRIPACYCGVVGHRSTPGLVPFEERTLTQTFYSVQGPMARTVADAALLLSVIARRDVAGARRDPMAFPYPVHTLADPARVEPSSLRIGVSEDLGGVVVSASIRRSFQRLVAWLSEAGVELVEVPADLVAAIEVDWRVRADIFATQYLDEAATWDEGFNPNIRATFDAALKTPMAAIAAARRTQTELFQSFQALFPTWRVDAILCPGVSVTPFPWADLYPRVIDGALIDNYMAWLGLTSALSVVGHPVTAIPAGLDESGMPFGVQVVGPHYGDRDLLGVAAALEEMLADTSFARPVPAVVGAATDTSGGPTDRTG